MARDRPSMEAFPRSLVFPLFAVTNGLWTNVILREKTGILGLKRRRHPDQHRDQGYPGLSQRYLSKHRTGYYV
jgi:hypothetical protein